MLCEKVTSKLVIAAPPSELVDSALQVIAEGYGISWKPPGSNDSDEGGLKVCLVWWDDKLILIRQKKNSQESLPSSELEPPLPADPDASSTAKATNSKLPDERFPDVGPSSSGLALPQSKQGTSEDDFEALKKRLDALRSRK